MSWLIRVFSFSRRNTTCSLCSSCPKIWELYSFPGDMIVHLIYFGFEPTAQSQTLQIGYVRRNYNRHFSLFSSILLTKWLSMFTPKCHTLPFLCICASLFISLFLCYFLFCNDSFLPEIRHVALVFCWVGWSLIITILWLISFMESVGDVLCFDRLVSCQTPTNQQTWKI